MAIPKHEYIMDYIPDKDLYKAVMYARDMIHKRVQASIAIRKAAYAYQVDMTDVAKYIGQCGGRKEKKQRRKQ